MSHKAAITITYCSQCNWMLRASWMAQELLHSFSTDIASVTLVPGTGGIFVVAVDDVPIWERKQDGGFPDAAELKRRVRDVCFRKNRWGTWTSRHNPQGVWGCIALSECVL
ncbi:selenoprotein W-related protein [Klebsiella oxytoca]|nr:selenoprotein W-related protein [Klebsiella oxytoca]